MNCGYWPYRLGRFESAIGHFEAFRDSVLLNPHPRWPRRPIGWSAPRQEGAGDAGGPARGLCAGRAVPKSSFTRRQLARRNDGRICRSISPDPFSYAKIKATWQQAGTSPDREPSRTRRCSITRPGQELAPLRTLYPHCIFPRVADAGERPGWLRILALELGDRPSCRAACGQSARGPAAARPVCQRDHAAVAYEGAEPGGRVPGA